MKRLNEYINETLTDKKLNKLNIEIKNSLNNLELNINIFNLPRALSTRLLPYIIEEQIKDHLKSKYKNLIVTEEPEDYKELFKIEDGNYKEYYDFKNQNNFFEIKSYQKGKKFSNVKFSSGQIKHKDDNNFIVIFVEYNISTDTNYINKITGINISNISIENINTLNIKENGQIIKNKESE